MTKNQIEVVRTVLFILSLFTVLYISGSIICGTLYIHEWEGIIRFVLGFVFAIFSVIALVGVGMS